MPVSGYPPDLTVPHEKTSLWRYMSLAKLLDLLVFKRLFMARLDKLGDPDEATLSRYELEVLKQQRAEKDTVEIFLSAPRKVVALCFCTQEFESFALWNQYGTVSEGIAIRSTVGKFCKALKPSKADITLARVNYVNMNEDRELKGLLHTGMNRAFRKRREYNFECECRAAAWISEFVAHYKVHAEEFRDFRGVHLPIDPQAFIESVIVAPRADDWYFDLVQTLVQRYLPTVNAVRSELTHTPPEAAGCADQPRS